MPISAPKANSHGNPALDFRVRARRDTVLVPNVTWFDSSFIGLSGRMGVACSVDAAALTGVATSVLAATATGMAVAVTGAMGSGRGVAAFKLVCSCKS